MGPEKLGIKELKNDLQAKGGWVGSVNRESRQALIHRRQPETWLLDL